MSSEAPAARRARWLIAAGRLVLIALVTWALFRAFGVRLAELDLRELARWRPAPVPVVTSMLLVTGVYLAHALLWRDIVAQLTGRVLDTRATVRIYFLSALGRYLPGKIWQLTGMAVLAERAGVPGVAAAGASVLGHLAFLVTGALLLVALLPGWAGSTTALLTAAAIATLAGLLFWLAARRTGERLAALVGERAGARVRSALEMLRGMRAGRAAVWGVAYVLTWVVLCGAFVMFAAAFVPEAAERSRHLAGTVAAAYLGGYIALAPAGAGVREGVMGLLLAQIMPANAAVVIAIASRLWFTLAEALVLIAVPFLRSPAVAAREAVP